jgi:tRNA dimethylallyltransferase
MKLVTILGPTCSGKTEMAINLAKHLQLIQQTVWIVGCDSKQIYTNLNIGTAKINGVWKNDDRYSQNKAFFYQNIPHFLIDYIDPFEIQNYSQINYLEDFSKLFLKMKPDYLILVGGTGFYAKNIYQNNSFLTTKSEFTLTQKNYKLKLENLNLEKLQQLYLNLDQNQPSFRILNQSDKQNKIRIISLLVEVKGFQNNWFESKKLPEFDKKYLFKIEIEKDKLNQNISLKVMQRLEQGFLEEVTNLLNKGLNLEFLLKIGLDYRLALLYLKGFINYPDFVTKSIQENQKYAKRQQTWLQKEPLIGINNLKDIVEVIEPV